VSLHQRIRHAIAIRDTSIVPYHEVNAALCAAVELHVPRPCTGFPADGCFHLDPHNVCSTCGSVDQYVIGEPDSTARCSTVQAIARELGVQEGGRG
jgi:hypothetical protein